MYNYINDSFYLTYYTHWDIVHISLLKLSDLCLQIALLFKRASINNRSVKQWMKFLSMKSVNELAH